MMFPRGRFVVTLVLGLFIAILTACGGGGGGGSGGSVTVTPTSLQFTADYGKALPSSQTVKVGYPDNTAGLLVGFPSDVPEATWIDAAALNQANPLDVAISVNSTYLSAGTHTTTLRFLAIDQNENLLGYQDLQISYTVQGELSASPTSLNLVQVIGGAENGATLYLTGTGGDSFGWSASVSYTSGQDWLLLNGQAEASGSALPTSLSVKGASIAPGVYEATIVLTAQGKTLQIPVTYTVRAPELLVDLLSLSFTGVSGQTTLPASKTVNVTSETGVAVNYSVAVNYTSGSNWLTLPTTGIATQAPLSVQPATTEMAPGLYCATVTLTPDNGTTAKQFSVTYNVTKSVLSATPANFDFVVDAATTPIPTGITALSRTGGALTWTATPSLPWLSITPSSGTSGSGESFTVSLVNTELEPLAVGLHNASITIAYEDAYGNTSSLEVPVSLDMRLPLFSVVTPYVGYSGRSDEIVIRGQGFLAMEGKNLLIGGTNTVSDFTIVNDTEIRVNHPSSLTAERYTIKAENALGLTRSTADLVVVDVPTYSYAAVPTTESARKLFFDSERQILHAVKWGNSNDRIERYAFNGVSWDKATLPLTTARDVTLTSDGKDLIALSNEVLYHVSPTSFSITSSVTENPSGYYDYLDQLVFMNDGSGLLTVGYSWTDLWNFNATADTFTSIPMGTIGSLYRPRLAASLDRSVVLLGENGVTGAAVFRYDPTTKQLSATPHTVDSIYLSIDRSGTRFCIDRKVYDSNFILLGTLPYYMSVCSPDGTRAHALDFTNKTVHTYDLTQTDGLGGFVEVSTGVPFAASVGQYAPSLAISQDGGTLFIGGDQNTIILPLP